MTVQQAIERADQMKAGNAVSQELKLEWLTEIEQNIFNDTIKMHQHPDSSAFWKRDEDGNLIKDSNGHNVFIDKPVYDEDSVGTELIAESPYDVLYVYWLMAEIDLFSQEYDAYNNDLTQYENAYRRYKAKYTTTHSTVPTPQIKVGYKV